MSRNRTCHLAKVHYGAGLHRGPIPRESHSSWIRHPYLSLAKAAKGVYIHGVRRTRLSLYYLAAYLLGAGIALIFAPALALTLLFASGHYGDVMPRLLGVVLLALGIIVVQIIRHRVEVLYPTTLIVRAFIVVVLLALLVYSRDPLFISLLVVVGFGMVLTGASYLRDRRATVPAMQPGR
jgi:uncharacterized protein YjeT (DUF2065 family)